MKTAHSRGNIFNYFSPIFYTARKLNEGTLCDSNPVPSVFKNVSANFFISTCIFNVGNADTLCLTAHNIYPFTIKTTNYEICEGLVLTMQVLITKKE